MEDLSGYYDDDGNKLNPYLLPKPALCLSCKSNYEDDPFEEILCNLNRLGRHEGEEFICCAHRCISGK